MTTDLLALTQWLSPAFPLGGFAYSHGLETAIDAAEVRDAPSLESWLAMVLRHGAGQTDAMLLSLTHCGKYPVTELAALARALAGSAERWEESLAQGTAFVATTNAILGAARAPMALPVAVGDVARRLDVPTDTVAALYLHAFVSNLVQVAVRFVPLGQTDGQAVLSRLHTEIDAVAGRAATADLDSLATCAIGAEMAAMDHEHQNTRIYRT